jgi:two-component system cell cycle sensor histidine kinase PleC
MTTRSPSQAYVRIAILAALLLLAVYTAFGIIRLQKEAQTPPGGAPLAAEASLVAGRIEANLAAQRAGLSAASDILQRDPAATMDAAEIALRAAGGEAMAVAVAGPTGVQAVAGRDESADWKAAVRAAGASGRSIWIGTAGQSGRLYVATVAPAAAGRAFIIASGDPSRLLKNPGKGGARAIALPDGALVASQGRAAQGASTFKEAFALSMEDVGGEVAALRGQGIDGSALDVAVQPLAEGALLAVAGAPSTTVANVDRRVMEGAFNLLAPLAVGIALALLLMMQSRKVEVGAERIRRWSASSASAWPSRPPAAASGNGTCARTRCSCPTSPARCSAGAAAGSSRARTCWTGSRRPSREGAPALASAASTAPSTCRSGCPALQQGGRSIWVDARGQGFGEARPRRPFADHRRGPGRHRGARGPGPRPGRREPPARRHRERVGSLRPVGSPGPAADVQPRLPQRLLAGARCSSPAPRASRSTASRPWPSPDQQPPPTARACARPSSRTAAGSRSPSAARPRAAW